MKLLFYIHGITGGGGERVLSTLVNEFSIRGEEVFLATDIHNSFAYDIDKRVKLYDLYDKCNKDYGTFSSIKNSVVIRRNIRRIAKKNISRCYNSIYVSFRLFCNSVHYRFKNTDCGFRTY